MSELVGEYVNEDGRYVLFASVDPTCWTVEHPPELWHVSVSIPYSPELAAPPADLAGLRAALDRCENLVYMLSREIESDALAAVRDGRCNEAYAIHVLGKVLNRAFAERRAARQELLELRTSREKLTAFAQRHGLI